MSENTLLKIWLAILTVALIILGYAHYKQAVWIRDDLYEGWIEYNNFAVTVSDPPTTDPTKPPPPPDPFGF
jgi:hypothetical protein